MKYEHTVRIETSEYICLVKRIDGVVAQKELRSELIRCKDCKHHYYHELLKQDYCDIPNMQFGEVNPNGYCYKAERKNHETD